MESSNCRLGISRVRKESVTRCWYERRRCLISASHLEPKRRATRAATSLNTASVWGDNPDKNAIYLNVAPEILSLIIGLERRVIDLAAAEPFPGRPGLLASRIARIRRTSHPPTAGVKRSLLAGGPPRQARNRCGQGAGIDGLRDVDLKASRQRSALIIVAYECGQRDSGQSLSVVPMTAHLTNQVESVLARQPQIADKHVSNCRLQFGRRRALRSFWPALRSCA